MAAVQVICLWGGPLDARCSLFATWLWMGGVLSLVAACSPALALLPFVSVWHNYMDTGPGYVCALAGTVNGTSLGRDCICWTRALGSPLAPRFPAFREQPPLCSLMVSCQSDDVHNFLGMLE